MAASKVNWKNKRVLEQAVQQSDSYASTLEYLGLKPVSANVKTLKKYIAYHDINIAHFQSSAGDNVIIEQRDENGYVKVEGHVDNDNGRVELALDWDDNFIKYLRRNGFDGTSEEQIIGSWLTIMYKDIAEKMRTEGVKE